MENANPEKPKVKINLQFFSYIYTNITLFKKKKRIYFHPFSQFGVNVNEGSLEGHGADSIAFFPRICGSKLLCPIAIPVKRERNRRVEVSRVSRDRIHPSWRMDFSTRRDVIASKAITVAPDRIAYCTPCSSLLL